MELKDSLEQIPLVVFNTNIANIKQINDEHSIKQSIRNPSTEKEIGKMNAIMSFVKGVVSIFHKEFNVRPAPIA